MSVKASLANARVVAVAGSDDDDIEKAHDIASRHATSIYGDFPRAITKITIDARSPLPIHEQIGQAIRTATWARELPPGTLLPTTRELAQYLGVGRNTVGRAYVRLTAEGFCVSNKRRGTRIASDLPLRVRHGDSIQSKNAGEAASAKLRIAFRASDALQSRVELSPSGAPFALYACEPLHYPRTKLGRRLANKFLGVPPRSQLGGARGGDRFQSAVASYLRQARGVMCEPEQIIAVSGLESALDLTARVVIDPDDTVWLDDPAMDIVHTAFRAARAHLRPTPADLSMDDGFSVEGPPPRLIYISPSASFPFGITMPETRRHEILRAGHSQNAVIFENDGHFELRYSGASIRSVQGHDRCGRVIYYGGFAETLGNAFNVGYMVVPLSLLDEFVEVSQRAANAPTLQVQEALAEFIENHEFAVHARNVRGCCAQRLELVKRACRTHMPQFEMSEPNGGIHLVLYFGHDFDAASICSTALAEGIPIRPLSQFCLGPENENAVVLGFSAIPEPAIDRVICRLGQLCAQYRRS